MNGFAHEGLDEGNFGETKGPSLKAFDAFPKTKQTYVTSTSNGGIATILVTVICIWLTFSEFARWMTGTTTHTFSVEKGVAHDLQINFDIIIAMKCEDLHINVQDASGDHIRAAEMVKKDPTRWGQWVASGLPGGSSLRELRNTLGKKGREASKRREKERVADEPAWLQQQALQYQRQEDVHDYLSRAKGRKAFRGTPRLGRGAMADSCRIYGSLEGNKVQGDFHITARGHGYQEIGEHLDHQAFNFSHYINEFSFGPYFPNLHNPLDAASATTPHHFFKYQYFMSIVPTIYTDAPHRLTSSTPPSVLAKRSHSHNTKNPSPHEPDARGLPQGAAALVSTPVGGVGGPRTIYTNQYAVTEHSHEVYDDNVPGLFFKYDIEPILLTVAEEWGGWLGLLVRCVNVVAGVMVAGGWVVRLVEWFGEAFRSRARRRSEAGAGLLYSSKESKE